MNKAQLQQHLQDIAKGLHALGRERKVVLSHHHTFELIDEMSGKVRAAQQGLATLKADTSKSAGAGGQKKPAAAKKTKPAAG